MNVETKYVGREPKAIDDDERWLEEQLEIAETEAEIEGDWENEMQGAS
jgi:hypothetical protein